MSTTARSRLVDALKAWDWSGVSEHGVQVVAGPAEVVVPPAVAVVPGDPYWEPSTYCNWAVSLRVSVIAARADSATALGTWEALAAEVWRCATALRGATPVEAGRITTVVIGDAELLAGAVTIRMEDPNG